MKLEYRREIDGLRAIAVLSVLVYHAGFSFGNYTILKGGFIGVDIFFVISGYLIGRIIFDELLKLDRINVVLFLEKRARRILPVLILTVICTLISAYFILLPSSLSQLAWSAVFSVFFASNFFFLAELTQYGSNEALKIPLLHTWSLAVEEQFYIFFPLAVAVAWRFAKEKIFLFILTIFTLSLLLSEYITPKYPIFSFYLPLTRFWEILLGSSIAYFEIIKRKNLTLPYDSFFSGLGIVFIFFSLMRFNQSTIHPAASTLIPIAGICLILWNSNKHNFINRHLSHGPIRYIGKISYSIYMVHFPIFAFSRIINPNINNLDKLILIVATLLLSILSYHSYEQLFRNRRKVSTKNFTIFLTISLCLTLSLITATITSDGFRGRLPAYLANADITASTDIESRLSIDGEICFGRTTNFCSFNSDKNKHSLFLIGDSHLAGIQKDIYDDVKERFNLTTIATPGCPFALGISRYNAFGEVFGECNEALQNSKISAISSSNKSIVVLFARYTLYLEEYFFNNKEGGLENGAAFYAHFENKKDKVGLAKAVEATLQKLLDDGHHIIIVYPVPEVGFDVPQRILTIMGNTFDPNIELDEFESSTSYEVFKERNAKAYDLFDNIKHRNVYRIYPEYYFCNIRQIGRCETIDINGLFYRDDDHLSEYGNSLLLKDIFYQIENARAAIDAVEKKTSPE